MTKQHVEDREERRQRRDRMRGYRKWMVHNLFREFSWSALRPEERRGRLIRDGLVILMSVFSILLYWACFLDSTLSGSASVLIFLFYLMPVSFVSVLYGWMGGIMCFTPVFVAAVVMSPSNAYFPFFHLAAIYLFHHIKTKGRCRTVLGTVLHGFVTGMLLSGIYYLVFVLVTAEAFSEVTLRNLILHITNIVPQSLLICFFIYWYTNHCGNAFKRAIGCRDDSMPDMVEQIRTHVRAGYRSLSGRIFSLLLIEAIVMGISAAFFANSLVPRMLEAQRTEMSAPEETEASDDVRKETEAADDVRRETPPPKGLGMPRPWDSGEFSDAFELARDHVPAMRFTYDDRGLAFDCKLIMMLLCIIHPIVLIANFIGQRLIAVPISDITGIMGDFGEDIEQRLQIGEKLDRYEIHSEDEIEALYDVMRRLVGELNSYIDEMKREQQLREDLRVARAASEAKSTFLSNVSHEIRTPINAVLGLDEMILRESGEEEIRQYAVDIQNAGKTLLGLVNDLLDFSRIEAGKMEILPVEYELSSTINDLINMVSAKAAEKGLELKVDVDADTPHVLYGDEIRIKQCMLNILNNAVKYTHKGSVTLSVSGRRLSADEIALSVRVVDTGIGIRKEDLDKLYSPFERIEESRNRTIEGTGLGMSIVKQLLDMMGSQLSVKSVYGEGSDFSFEVNQRVVNWEPIGDFNATYRNAAKSAMEYHVRFTAPEAQLLVVDDTPMNLTVVRGLLKPTLVRVDTATSGAECLERIRQKAYDIIFMDQRMPEMDGTQTLQAIRAMPAGENKSHDAPVVILTANVVAGARESFLAAGFNDYLSKPIDAGKLEQMIMKMLPPDKLHAPEDTAAARDESPAVRTGDNAFMQALSQVEGIDVEAALANCMTEEILEGAVHDFTASIRTQPDQIERMWRDGDWKNYTIAVHALKSSSRLVGALALSALAAELEAAGDASDRARIDEKTPALLFMYRAFYDKLMDVCAIRDLEQGAPGGGEIGDNQLAEAYDGIREAVAAYDYDTADEIVRMLADYVIPDAERERFEHIRDLVNRLDRDALMEELG